MSVRNNIQKLKSHGLFLGFLLFAIYLPSQDTLILKKSITDEITPKSIVHNGNGLFAAQNMMYKHTVTFYDRNGLLVATVDDDVDLSKFDSTRYSMMYWGAPVEGAFSNNGKYFWVSNYAMKGGDFNKPGCDECDGKKFDKSYVYKINTWNFNIEAAVEVGSVPKFLAINDKLNILAVANWTSGDVYIINTLSGKVIQKITVGKFPRGIAIHQSHKKIYVALMGERRIAEIDMNTWLVSYIEQVGKAPRHLCLDENKNLLYASVNEEGRVAKIDLKGKLITYVETGKSPRSMALTNDGKILFVTNFGENTISKIITKNMKVSVKIPTNKEPVGVALDEERGDVWVACYSGSLMIFNDKTILHEKGVFAYLSSLISSKSTDVTTQKEKKLGRTKKKKEIEKLPEIGVWIVVVGSFKNESLAKKLNKKLIKKGYNSQIIVKDTGFYMVTCASSNSREEMNAIAEKLKVEYPDAWVTKRPAPSILKLE